MKWVISLLSVVLLGAMTTSAFGQTLEERLTTLEQALKSQARTIEEQQKTIEELKTELTKQKSPVAQESGLEASGKEEPSLGSKVSGFFGGSALTNPYISAVVNTYGYSSNLSSDQLKIQGIPGFTIQGLGSQRGFNFDSVELALFAPVDPYFNLYTNIPITDNGVTVEEAYAVTTALPEGFQLKGGKFKSNFSRLDAQHPHAWDFFDIAIHTGPSSAARGSAAMWGSN